MDPRIDSAAAPIARASSVHAGPSAPPIVAAVRPGRIRFTGAFVAVAALALLAVARYLRPAPGGIGTHEALGLPPCGFYFAFGIPCPSCGMTTAFSLFAHGRPLAALRAQPAGCALALLAALAVGFGLRMAWSGKPTGLNWDRLGTRAGLSLMGLVFFGGWAWKIIDHLLHR